MPSNVDMLNTAMVFFFNSEVCWSGSSTASQGLLGIIEAVDKSLQHTSDWQKSTIAVFSMSQLLSVSNFIALSALVPSDA